MHTKKNINYLFRLWISQAAVHRLSSCGLQGTFCIINNFNSFVPHFFSTYAVAFLSLTCPPKNNFKFSRVCFSSTTRTGRKLDFPQLCSLPDKWVQMYFTAMSVSLFFCFFVFKMYTWQQTDHLRPPPPCKLNDDA